MNRLIADTAYLVALGRKADPLHASARAFAASFKGHLVTSTPVIVESCHFLSTQARLDLLQLVSSERLTVVEVPVSAYPALASTIRKYAEHDVDFADASLVWLAEQIDERRVLTADVADFSILRLKGGRRFELVEWMPRG